MNLPRCLALASLSVLALAPAASCFAQGSLTPPGAPAPTMKSLSELDGSLSAMAAKAEARIPIDTLLAGGSALKVISAPGSYYLRGNLTTANDALNGISVEADGVVIDLNGFALRGSGAGSSGTAIFKGAATVNRLVIRNGTITGWNTGLESATDVLAEDLIVSDCSGWGVALGFNSIARHVTVRNVGFFGIVAGLVEGCRVNTVGPGGGACGILADIVRDSEVNSVTAIGVGTGYGIQANSVLNCRVFHVVSAAGVAGIGPNSSVLTTCEQCVVDDVTTSNTGATVSGISLSNVSHCTVNGVGGAGFIVYGILGTQVEACIVSTTTTTNPSGSVTGISAVHVQGCRVTSTNGAGSVTTGIFGQQVRDNTVLNVSPSAGTGYGIRADSGGQILNNSVNTVRNYGIEVNGAGATIAENNVRNVGLDTGVTTGVGIYCSGNFNHIERNRIVGASTADYGIRVVNSFNFIIGNRCTGNFSGASTGATGLDLPEYNISIANRFGPVVGTFAATGEITATNPFTNFSD